jgi:hypothetical protein
MRWRERSSKQIAEHHRSDDLKYYYGGAATMGAAGSSTASSNGNPTGGNGAERNGHAAQLQQSLFGFCTLFVLYPIRVFSMAANRATQAGKNQR